MKVIFVKAAAAGYSEASHNEKTYVAYMPILVEDDFDIDRVMLTPLGIEQPPGLEYNRLVIQFKRAMLKM